MMEEDKNYGYLSKCFRTDFEGKCFKICHFISGVETVEESLIYDR